MSMVVNTPSVSSAVQNPGQPDPADVYGEMLNTTIRHEVSAYSATGVVLGALIGASSARSRFDGAMCGAILGGIGGALAGVGGGILDGVVGASGASRVSVTNETGFIVAGTAPTALTDAVIGSAYGLAVGGLGRLGAGKGMLVGALIGGVVGTGFGYWNTSSTLRKMQNA